MSEWKIFARDKDNKIQGEIEDYTQATLSPLYCDVGSWSIELSRKSKMAEAMTQPGSGIYVTRAGEYILSGRMTDGHHTVSGGKSPVDKLTVSGSTDEIWLLSRLASPSPGESLPPYTTQATDVRTGVASTVIQAYVNVNLGPGAVPTRRKSNFTIGTDPLLGASVRGEARWDADLLAFLQPLAVTGGVGFRVVQIGTGLQFQTYGTTDRSADVKFSVKLGNLSGFEYTTQAPKANYVYVGASGTGTARIVKEFSDNSSISTWERWEGPLANQGSTSDSTALAQAGADALAQGAEQASLSITPIETDTLKYGRDYFLGDKVAIQLSGPTSTPYANTGQIVDIVRQVTITLSGRAAPQVVPTVGTSTRVGTPRVINYLRALNRRVNNLERS